MTISILLVVAARASVGAAAAPFRMRPRSGKVSPVDAATISAPHERYGDVVGLGERLARAAPSPISGYGPGCSASSSERESGG